MDSTTCSPSQSATATAKGRRVRKHLLFAIGTFLVLITVALVLRRHFGSWEELPDVGDPFDVAEVRRSVNIPDTDNAFVAYAEAHRKLAPLKAGMAKVDFGNASWSKTAPAVHDFLEQNRSALDTWRGG